MDFQSNDMSETVDLKETVAVLLRRKWLIMAVTTIVTAGSVGLSMAQTPVYCATSTVVIRPVVPPAALNSFSYSMTGPLGLDVSPESEAQIARSTVVAEKVAKDLGTSVTTLPGSIGVKVVTDQLLGFTGCSVRAADSAKVAQTFAVDYLAYRREGAARALTTIADQMKQQIDVANRDIEALDTRILAVSQRAGAETDPTRRQAAITQYNQLNSDRNQAQFKLANFQSRYNDIQGSLSSASSGGGEVVQPAVTPTAPSSPKPARNGVLGFMLGFMLAVGLAFLRQHFDDRIRDLADASRAAGTLVLGVIPKSHTWKNLSETHVESIEDPSSPVAEGYRGLRQALSVMGVGDGLKTVLVTSGSPDEGKSTTSANLGVAFARTGVRTVVVSADLRRPRLHKFLGVGNEVGVSEILAGTTALEAIEPTRIPNLWVLPSGGIHANPAELLDGARLGGLLEKLRGVADVVIIDGPPLAAGADAMVLSRFADVTLLLMRQDKAHAGGAKAAVAELSKAGAARIAAVLTMAHGKLGGYGYGKYGYGYGYGYTAATPDRASNGTVPSAGIEASPALSSNGNNGAASKATQQSAAPGSE